MWKVMWNNQELQVEENGTLYSLAGQVQEHYKHDILLASMEAVSCILRHQIYQVFRLTGAV